MLVSTSNIDQNKVSWVGIILVEASFLRHVHVGGGKAGEKQAYMRPQPDVCFTILRTASGKLVVSLAQSPQKTMSTILMTAWGKDAS